MIKGQLFQEAFLLACFCTFQEQVGVLVNLNLESCVIKHKHVYVAVPTAAVENGETDASAVETWEQKGEPDEEEPGGGSSADTGFCGDEAQDEMMEEDEEMPTPKLPPPPPDAPKKEHVNVVFIGHVGMLTCL